MTQSFRLADGGLIDRSVPIGFSFDGRPMQGYLGDTLASALLANGQHLVARSIKYHRPRGILSAGLEEPSALVSVDFGSGRVPNLKATEVTLTDGLAAFSQNASPSLERDRGALAQIGARLMGAGFYYKTFMWPRKAWHATYERIIRRAAGHGVADPSQDPALYDKRNLHCDILVIGAGPAGLMAALTAARGGATVAIIERDQRLGGSLLWADDRIEGAPALDWAEDAALELATLSNVTVMPNTLVFGRFDHGLALAIESPPAAFGAQQIFWKIRAERIILAAGATERPILFSGNDRPGVMLASAVRHYIRRFAVAPGRRAVIAVSDVTERAATRAALERAGVEVAAELGDGDTILAASGGLHLRRVRWRTASGRRGSALCDLLCVSAGWSPTAHLFAQMGTALHFDRAANCLIPRSDDGMLLMAGAARGALGLDDCLADGKAQAHFAMGALELHKPMPPRLGPATPQRQTILGTGGKAFVDLQNDVTRNDVAQAAREGYGLIELAKRYTTLGMGTDQGKASWTNGILALAEATGVDPAELGHTTYRPPYSPVSLGALVGTETGSAMTPTRRSPFHQAFETAGCVFQTSGDWLYPRYCPQPGETMAQSIDREVRAVRAGVGYVDMSTLGKFELRGPDALGFLERVYCNDLGKLKEGRLRYSLMLREDGIVFDDGIVARLGAEHFLLTATTARAASVGRHLRKLLQIDWPDLRAQITDVSEHWASMAIAGPRARELLDALAPDFDTRKEAFPFAAVRTGRLAGNLPVRVFSVSFSGEQSYEINVAAGFAQDLWKRLTACGAQYGLTPYGLEALDVLRIEKGHISVGTEIDGRRTPDDLGLGGLVSARKDYLGRALLQRPALQASGRQQLVGFAPADGVQTIPAAAHLSDRPSAGGERPRLIGHLTAAVHSPAAGHPIALGFLEDGRARIGERLWALSPIAGAEVEVEVRAACSHDPEGAKLRA